MKALLLGSNGYVGSALLDGMEDCGIEVRAYTGLDSRAIRNRGSFRSEAESFGATAVVNCVGYCGESNLDDCERDPDRTLKANLDFPLVLSRHLSGSGIKLVHISSACVFDSFEVVRDDSHPNMTEGVYRSSKVAAEYALISMSGLTRTHIIRIRMPFDGRFNEKRNLLSKIAGYRKIVNHRNSMTYLPYLARDVSDIVSGKLDPGLISHHVCHGTISHQSISKLLGLALACGGHEIIDEDEFRRMVKLRRTALAMQPSDCFTHTRRIDIAMLEALNLQ